MFFVKTLFSQLYICMWRLQFYTHVESIWTTAPFHSSSLAKGYEKGDPNRNPWLAKMSGKHLHDCTIPLIFTSQGLQEGGPES